MRHALPFALALTFSQAVLGCVVDVTRDRTRALRCGAMGRCATGLVCAPDGYCRPPDGGVDGGAADGGADGGCARQSCLELSAECGRKTDRCGNLLDCPACAAPDGGTATCIDHRCARACPTGNHECDGTCKDDTRLASCGSRCDACAAPENSEATCDGTTCGFQCRAPFCKSDGGCVDSRTSTEHCGTCGRPCSAGEACVLGNCRAARMIVFGGKGAAGDPLGDVFALELGAAPRWLPLAPTGTPPTPRAGARAVHDAANNRVLLYGGVLAGGTTTGEVWSLALVDPPAWSLLADGALGPPRRFPAVALDRATSTAEPLLVISHGNTETGDDCQSETFVLGVGAAPAWSSLLTSGQALRPVFNGVAYAHDAAGRRLFVHGGEGHGAQDGGPPSRCAPCCPYYNDTYALSLAGAPAWSRIEAGGALPDGTGGAALVFDPLGARLLRFGGRTQHGASFDATHALLLPNGGSPFWVDASRPARPPARGHAAAVHDPVGARMIVAFGRGAALLRDAWALDLSSAATVGAWTDLSPAGLAPAAREQAAFVYVP